MILKISLDIIHILLTIENGQNLNINLILVSKFTVLSDFIRTK